MNGSLSSPRREPGELTTAELLRKAALVVEASWNTDTEKADARALAAVLRERSYRLDEYIRMAGTPGANETAANAVRALCRDEYHNGVCDRAVDFLRRAGRELQPRGKTKIWPMPSRSSRRAR